MTTENKKGMYQDPAEIDDLLWARVREADLETVTSRARVSLDPERSVYLVPHLAWEFRVNPATRTIEASGEAPHSELDFLFYLGMLHYLVGTRAAEVTGQWISEKEIPGGLHFFRGLHALVPDLFLELFADRVDLFAAAAEALGGVPADFGDAAYILWPFPRLPLLLILWRGDEEFGAELHVRFDASINEHQLPLDVILAMVWEVLKSLRSAGKAILEGGP